MFTRVKSWLKKDSGFYFRMLVSRMSGGDGRDNPKALDCRRLEMAHLQYALLQVCGWYPDQLHTSKIAITPGDLDVTITTIGEVYYSLFVEKYASMYSDNIHRLHVAVTFHSHNISTSLLCLCHRCQFLGCQVALVMDGNMKSWRDVCMAQEAGYIKYEGLEGKIKTGCLNRNFNIAHWINHELVTPLPDTAVKKHPLNHWVMIKVLSSYFWRKKATRTATYYKVVGQASLILIKLYISDITYM